MNTDFLISMPASNLHIGDKIYLGEERYGKLLTCKSLSPITATDSFLQTEYILEENETVYLPDPVMQYIIEYIPDYFKLQDYIQLENFMAIINSADLTEKLDPDVAENLHNKVRYLYARLFQMARKHSSK